LDIKLTKLVSFAVLAVVLGATGWMALTAYQDTYQDVEVKYHSIKSHSLGIHQQGELVRARVIFDEGSVKVLEGRAVTLQILDSDNRASMEQGRGYIPLAEVEVDTKETDEGYLEYKAHITDTYYLVYRNEDWWNLTLIVANGEALDQQLFIKMFSISGISAIVIIFMWAYSRLFDIPLGERLGSLRRPKGPGSRSARERRVPTVEDSILEAEDESDLLG
jgi:hypothetical protein